MTASFLWPGFGENLRVLRWIIERCENRMGATEHTRLATCRNANDIETDQISTSAAEDDAGADTSIDVKQWQDEMAATWLSILKAYGESPA